MSDYPGGETLNILAPQGTGRYDSLNQEITQLSIAWTVYGCVFEPYTRGPVEEENDTVTSHERAWAFLPYVQGIGIPGVDTNGDQGVVSINNANWIQPQRPNDAVAQRNYKVQGLPEIEYDLDGAPSYAWVVCEWQGG